MDVQETIAKARDTMTVTRVFGEPYDKDGVTFIPAAAIRGGAGGGGGEAPDQGGGSGGGYGVTARPVGAYVLRQGEVQWQPAVDVNRIVLGGQIFGVFALLLLRRMIKVRAKRRRRR